MIWNDTKNLLKNSMSIGEYNEYIDELEYDIHASRSDLAILYTQNELLKRYIISKYKHIIVEAFEKRLGYVIDVEILLKNNDSGKKNVNNQKNALANTINITQLNNISNINPYYTFDKFIVGESNKYAYNIAQSICKKQSVYNPVLFYGNTGLGKTHLLHAIGNYVKNINKEVIFVTSEEFLNDFMSRIKTGTMDRFRDKYRNCDYLLIDDVQFFGNKENIQEEFFHTFNELYNKKNQIVMTSDRLPKYMRGFEERLKSRFELGTMPQIEIPGIETKIAIIKLKCDLNNINLDNETINHIATHANENIRQIEGILTNINTRMGLIQASPLSIAKIVLEEYRNKKQEDITIKHIINTVCKELNIKISEIESGSRVRNVTFAKKIIIYLSKELTNISLINVANELGMKDHSSVSKAMKSIKQEIEENDHTKALIEEIKNKINTQ